MKKIIFGLLLLVGSVLLLINYLTNIDLVATDKISNNVLSQLIATGNKPATINTKVAETKPTLTEQVTNATDTTLAPLNAAQVDNAPPKNKSPIAIVKIYDKKTAKEITIETQSMLEAQQQLITPQQQEEQKNKTEKFKAYYHKPEKCLSPSNQEIRVACGNEYMRAKATFEELWQQGKFKN